jgi:oxygen-dependent protoporphyrinogen oxidase
MKRIAIVGGGISGLSAAFRLQQQMREGAGLEYVLFESSSRLGGVVSTERLEGCIIEAGPDSFLSEKKWASDLCCELGLADQLIGSQDAGRKTYILIKNQLVPIPDGLVFMVPTKILPVAFSPLFSLRTKLNMAREWFGSKPAPGDDESIASLVERHYGQEMVDRLADPLLLAVYGGQASELSVRAVLPRLAQMEEKHGSLGRGLLARKVSPDRTPNSSGPVFTSLAGGMQQIVDALAQRLSPLALRIETRVESVQREDEGWRLSSRGRPERFDAIIVATPAGHAARLLQPSCSALSAELAGIQYSSSVIVNIVFNQEVRSRLPPGFGLLVPRSEGKRVLAVTFVHNKFNGRAPENRALLRCFLGGTQDGAILDLREDQIVQLVRQELRQTLRISADPLLSRVHKWTNVMAQYGVGHLDRLNRIAVLQQGLPALALAGNAYGGIGVPDCVRSGSDAAFQSLRALGFGQSATLISSRPRT